MPVKIRFLLARFKTFTLLCFTLLMQFGNILFDSAGKKDWNSWVTFSFHLSRKPIFSKWRLKHWIILANCYEYRFTKIHDYYLFQKHFARMKPVANIKSMKHGFRTNFTGSVNWRRRKRILTQQVKFYLYQEFWY